MSSETGQQQADSTLDLVLFKAGPYSFGLEASKVRGSGEPSAPDIPTAESLLALSGEHADRCRKCLTIKGSGRDYELSVSAPFELCAIPVDAIHPLPIALAARCRLPGLRALALTERGLILLVDLQILLGQN